MSVSSSRLIVVSNRLPIAALRKEGVWSLRPGSGGLVTALAPDARLGFFLHIPFPPPDVFAKLPWRTEILWALLAYDLVGFQTVRDRRNFIAFLRARPDLHRKIALVQILVPSRSENLPFETRMVLFHDQTEETDGDRRRQREGWPAGEGERSP